MAEERLFLNTITFEYPQQPVRFYFSDKDDAEHKSTRLKSPVLVPKEVKQTPKYIDLFSGVGGFALYTSYDLPFEGFDPIDIDFNEPENENLVWYSQAIQAQLARINGKSFDIVIHPTFVPEEPLKSAFVYNFRQSQKDNIEIPIVCRIVLEFVQELLKLAFLTSIKTDGEHSYIVVLFYCL